MEISNLILNLKLRIKLLLAFGSILLLTALLFLIFFHTLNRIDSYQQVSEKVDGVNIHLLEMDAAAQYFIFDGFKNADFHKHNRSTLVETYALNLGLVQEELAAIGSVGLLDTLSSARIIASELNILDAKFNQLIDLFRKRGFKDFGLEGQLRSAIHEVENTTFNYNKADLLTLRRHEKDFFLRKDLKYQIEFNKKFDQFIASVQEEPVSDGREAIVKNLLNYQQQFNSVVDIDSQIGLMETDGLKGDINKHLSTLKGSIQDLRIHIKEKSRLFKQQSMAILITLFIVQLALGIVLTVVYSGVITKAIKELRKAMKDLSDGIFPPKLLVKSSEEIGQTKAAFNQLLDRMKAAQSFSEDLGKGNINASYNSLFTDDILARSLISMQRQLVTSHNEQVIINWNNVGAAQLNDLLKAENEEITALGDKIIKLLVNYLGANQGALYMVKQNELTHYAERVATFAYEKKKYVDQRIDAGQGLIGQCLLERSTIILTDIPVDYVKITSGLGEALPNYVIIIPLAIRSKLEGIIEIASFQKLKKYQVDFLEKIAENIASIVSNKNTNLETSRLLNEARERAEQLTSQEEEIRQNAEEMEAIQEQLEREKNSMEKEIQLLKSLLAGGQLNEVHRVN